VELSDIIEIHTLELVKLPESADGTELYDWAKFIAADTEEELDMIAERNPQVARAVVRFRELTADERVRDLHERREKARRDMEAGKRWALKQQALEIARNLLKMSLPIEKIITATELTREEI
jgi:predicted transposase/invertase (TIGR01784 family)